MSLKQVAVDSTPVMIETVGYGGTKSRIVTGLIERELQGASLLDVDGLIQHIFPYESMPFDLDDVLDKIKKSGALYRDGHWVREQAFSDADNNPFVDGPQTSEALAAQFLNSVAQGIEAASGLNTDWRWSGAWANTPVLFKTPCERKPDFILKHKDLGMDEATWADARSAGEVKENAKTDNVKDAERGLSEDARLMFGSQPNRRYVVGLAACRR